MLRHRPAAKICPQYSMGTNSIPMASERLRGSSGGRSAGRGKAPTSEDFGAEQGRVGAFALLTGKRPREARLRWRGSAERGPSCAPGVVN
jgi:hypothetical protein